MPLKSKEEKKEFYSISELATEFDISQRTIRFYEEKGLISPARSEGNQRIYSRRDRTRLKLILRGKRFGYSLEEISEVIGMSDVNLNEIDQIQKTLELGQRRLTEIDRDLHELKLLKQDLKHMHQTLLDRLKAITLEKKKN